jgi:hypothetical protein
MEETDLEDAIVIIVMTAVIIFTTFLLSVCK